MIRDTKIAIVWLAERDDSRVLHELRERGYKVYAASFYDLRESIIFIGNKTYTLEEAECSIIKKMEAEQ